MGAEVSHLPPLRADARRNRDRIVDVARTLFADRGLDVPMTAVARRAGVGAATLYRRFPTKEALVTQVFADQFARCVAVVDDALADPDPWRGLRDVVATLCAMQAADRGFCAAFVTAFPDAIDIGRERDRALSGLAELVRRAQEAGLLRADVTVDDLVLLLLANRGLVAGTAEEARAASRRLVGFVLDALRADRTHREPLPPPVAVDLHRLLDTGPDRPRRPGSPGGP
ncbi:TetR/AcrR family transcriptional regulator [Pseudonocardia endophytica]|uniref:TetR family transcriptional regulator n=1 Tax=Pseudonocardia endophytica TaxID=401976 RepID=A0A4R1HVD1_PSEEN|nr:TetR/AcrR family transcriptional regulator [Pseudonocardia endophytica]TCK26218.1 TetR family transcriptional regulator [Pseudonocardia endophytica]